MGGKLSQLAKDRLKLCKQEKYPDLNFRNVGLTAFHPSMLKLRWLTKLVVAGNQLETIPDEIALFDKLEHLDASDNTLRAISKNLGTLRNLKHLALSGNFLEELPPCEELARLEYLSISANAISSLPSPLIQAARATLRELHWNGNRLRTLPATVSTLGSLRVISVDNNELTTLDPILQGCFALEEIHASGNAIDSLPDDVAKLPQLKILKLSLNRLNALPPSIVCCPLLEQLDVADNRITALPEDIGRLASVKDLILSRNQLSAIPASVGRMSRLFRLDLAGNRVTELPFELGFACDSLRKVGLGQNQLKRTPGELGYLTPSVDLNVAGNPLEQPFSDFVADPTGYLRASLPLVQPFPPECTIEDVPATSHSKARAMNEFTITLKDLKGNPRTLGGDFGLTAVAVRRSPANVATAEADPDTQAEAAMTAGAPAAAAAGGGAASADGSASASAAAAGVAATAASTEAAVRAWDAWKRRGSYSVGLACVPEKAEAGSVEQLIVKDLGNGTYQCFYNIMTEGVYDMWIRLNGIAIQNSPSQLILDP